MIVTWKMAAGMLLTLLLEALKDRMLLARFVTHNGLIMHDGPDGDFTWRNELPVFNYNMHSEDVVQVFRIEIPYKPRRVFVVRPTKQWVEAYNHAHTRLGPDALTPSQVRRTLLHEGEYELVEVK